MRDGEGGGKKVIVLQNHTTHHSRLPGRTLGRATARPAQPAASAVRTRVAALRRKTALRARHAARGRAERKDWHSAGRVPRRSYSLHSQAPCSQIGPTGAPFAEHFEGSSGKEAGGMLEVDPPTARPLGWVGGSTLRYTPTVTRVKLLNVCVHARPEEEKRRCSMRREHTRQARDPQSNRQHA